MPTNMSIMKKYCQLPERNTPSPSFMNDPIRRRKRTESMSRMTVKDETVVMISTSFDDAITKNAMTNDAVAFRFFLGYFLPSIVSVPKTFVFSRIAKTIVKTSRNGRTTSNNPISLKNSMTERNALTMNNFLYLSYLNLSVLVDGGKLAKFP